MKVGTGKRFIICSDDEQRLRTNSGELRKSLLSTVNIIIIISFKSHRKYLNVLMIKTQSFGLTIFEHRFFFKFPVAFSAFLLYYDISVVV